MAMIEIRQLSKFYGSQRGIENIELSIDAGEIFGFIGPNGAGKSTLIRLLLSLIFPTTGTALIDGKNCLTESRKVKHIVGYAPADANYYGDMAVGEFLQYSAGFYHKDCQQIARQLADELELDLEKKIKTLSDGNKKKVGILQALQHEPKVLIFDEPTRGLDPLIQNRFFQLLEQEREKGTTILFSSHILSEVERICDRVGIIREGRLLKIETVEKLKQSRFKQVKVKYQDQIPDFSQLKVNDYTEEDTQVSFLYNGTMKTLLEKLEEAQIVDLTITEPSLEAIVLHYYEREDSL